MCAVFDASGDLNPDYQFTCGEYRGCLIRDIMKVNPKYVNSYIDSASVVSDCVFTVGKYKGRSLSSVLRDHPRYIRWIFNQQDIEFERVVECLRVRGISVGNIPNLQVGDELNDDLIFGNVKWNLRIMV